MFYIAYKTTNKVNGKVYYGVHKTSDLEDGYLGSGVVLRRAVRKYGRSSFNREILSTFSSETEMYEYEKSLITEAVVNDPMTYNQTVGGRGGFSHISSRGSNNPMKKLDVRNKVVATKIRLGLYHTEAVVAARLKATAAAAKSSKGKKRPEHAELMRAHMTSRWSSKKELMRDALSSWFELRSPDGEVYRTNRLAEWCLEFCLPYTTIWGNSLRAEAVKKGPAKGWRCAKVNKDQ